MRKNEVIVIADISQIGKRTYMEEFFKLPYRFVMVRNSDCHSSFDEWGRDYFSDEEIIEVGFRDPQRGSEHARDELQKRGLKAKAVCTYSETTVLFTDQLAKLLELPRISSGDPLLARNKFLMREAWKEARLCQPDYYLCQKSEELDQILDRIQFPIVVKPTEFYLSEGITKIGKDDRLKIREAYLAASRVDSQEEDERHPFNLSSDVIIESYIPAEFEISCEAVVFEGRVLQSFLTKKYLTPEPDFYELGHSTPLSFGQDLDQKIDDCLVKALQAQKIENAVVHAEFRIRTPDREPVLVEIAARMGGGNISFLVQLATGYNLFEACVDLALGKKPATYHPEASKKIASVHFLEHKDSLSYLRDDPYPDEHCFLHDYDCGQKVEGLVGDYCWLSKTLDEAEERRRDLDENY